MHEEQLANITHIDEILSIIIVKVTTRFKGKCISIHCECGIKGEKNDDDCKKHCGSVGWWKELNNASHYHRSHCWHLLVPIVQLKTVTPIVCKFTPLWNLKANMTTGTWSAQTYRCYIQFPANRRYFFKHKLLIILTLLHKNKQNVLFVKYLSTAVRNVYIIYIARIR